MSKADFMVLLGLYLPMLVLAYVGFCWLERRWLTPLSVRSKNEDVDHDR